MMKIVHTQHFCCWACAISQNEDKRDVIIKNISRYKSGEGVDKELLSLIDTLEIEIKNKFDKLRG